MVYVMHGMRRLDSARARLRRLRESLERLYWFLDEEEEPSDRLLTIVLVEIKRLEQMSSFSGNSDFTL